MSIDKRVFALLVFGALLLSACAALGSDLGAGGGDAPEISESEASSGAEVEESDTEESSVAETEAEESPAGEAEVTASGYICGDGSDPFAGADLKFRFRFWPETDFCQHSIDYDEVLGLLQADQISPIDNPRFESISDANSRIADQEPVIVFEYEGDARAYPLSVMTWHEIANDVVGGKPVTVTYCPLCNAAIVFDSTVDGEVLRFGTSGNLRHSDLIMWDDKTNSWWQQFTGEGIVGEMTGTQLEFLPSQVTSWAEFKEAFPDGQALDTASVRDYGRNPYVGYDSNADPFAFVEEADPRLFPVERVLGLFVGGEAVAYPFESLSEAGIINETRNGEDVAIFFQPGQVSALDGPSIADSRDVGSAAAFSPLLDGEKLTFSYNDGIITDDNTGSRWNVFGQAIDGELAGEELDQLLGFPHFWFAWAVFQPETAIWEATA